MSSRVHPVLASRNSSQRLSVAVSNSIIKHNTSADHEGMSQFNMSSTSSATSSLTGKSSITTAASTLFNWIVMLRPKESMTTKENTYALISMIFYHVYLIYNSIIVSSITTPLIDDSTIANTSGISNKLWGVIPAWIWRSLYFPLNLASEFYPYYLIIAFSALFLVLQLLTGMAIYYCKWASRKGGKLFEKVKSFVLNSLIFQRTFNLFILSIHCLLLSPSISSLGSLYYFPDESFSKVIQIVFTIIACIGVLLNIALTMTATYLTVETSVQLNRKTLFSLYTTSPFLLFNLVNQLSLISTILCTAQYSFIASILKIVMNIILLIITLKSLPFFRKWENSFYIAIISLKIFTPISPLILQFISTSTMDQQVIGGIMTAVTLVLAILSFILGFTASHFYISFKLKSIRNLISIKEDSSNTMGLLDESKKRQDNLSLFIRFAINCKEEEKSEEGSDFDLAKHCVNTFVKSIENVELMITSALFVSFAGIEEYDDSQAFSIGLALLQKAQRNSPSIAQLFNIMLRNEEIEYHAFHGNNLEILRKLATVEKKLKSLSRCHKSFFKELLNDKPSIDKLEHINRTSCSIYNECDTIYDNLLISNRSNKTLIRSYASYLETYKWELNLARDLFEEAQDNDDDKKNTKSMNITKKSQMAMHRYSVDIKTDENWDSISAVAEEENEEERKDNLLRSTINTPMSTVVYSSSFALFCFISIVCMCIVAPLALSFSQSINERITMQEKVCTMTAVPYKLLTQIRALQTSYLVFGNVSETLFNSTLAATNSLLDKVALVIDAGENNELISEVAEEYLKSQYSVQIPIGNSSLYNTTLLNSYNTANASIQLFLTLIQSQGKAILSQYYDLKTLSTNLETNYPFLFLYYNRLTFLSSFDSFCNQFIKSSVKSLNSNFEYLWITTIAVLGVYLVIAVLYFIILFVHLRRQTLELKEIFRRIAKDEVGKIYHKFDKKIDDTMISRTDVVKSNVLVMVGSVLLCLIVCLCCGMVLVEFSSNTSTSAQSMDVVGTINSVTMRITRSNFRLIELIARLKYMTVERTSVKESNKLDIVDLRSYWNSIAIGDSDTNFKSVVIGKYDDIDNVMGDTCNDTVPIENPCHSLSKQINSYVSTSLELNEVYYDHTLSMGLLVISYFEDIFYVTQTVTSQIQYIISLLVAHEKVAEVSITTSMIALCIVSTILYAVICFTSLKKYWKERACLRMMLNYVNLELIDNNLILKDYVMTNTIPSSKVASRIMSRFESGDEKEDKIEMVKTILNGGVDSAIICDRDGNITIFNNSAEEMFGYSRSQVLGLSIQSLFTEEDSQRITKLISTGESHDAFEAMALRKNKTSFSSKVSVSISIHEKKQILILFIRDITPEKKQGILIAEEKKKSEDLLLNILPLSMASRLKNGEENLYEKVNDITVFFSDMVGFTAWSSKLQPSELVQILNLIVQGFDKLTEIHLIDKIKTIGDAYFCVSGLHSSKSSDHPERMLKFSIEIMSFLKNINQNNNTAINLRIGVHTGDAVGGVIGFKKFAYDLWGDTINTASRMESTSLPGRIQISRSTYGRVYDLFEFEERMIEVKGKGLCQTYLLKDKHHENPLDCALEVLHNTPSSPEESTPNIPQSEQILPEEALNVSNGDIVITKSQ